jgi:hypothetical protein
MDAQSKGQKGERSIKPLTAEELEQQKKKADVSVSSQRLEKESSMTLGPESSSACVQEIMEAKTLELAAKYGDMSKDDLWAHYSRELLVACARTQGTTGEHENVIFTSLTMVLDLEMETGEVKVASPDENPSKGRVL